MKPVIIIFVSVFVFSQNLFAQDAVQLSLKNATEQYNQKKLLDAQKSLQSAVTEINNQIGQQVLDALPKTAGDLSADLESDMNGVPGGDLPCASVNVSREYLGNDNSTLLLNIVSNTATATNIKTAIDSWTPENNPEQVQKIIYINERKALMTWDLESASGDIQIAAGTTFLIISGDGFKDSDAFTAAAYKLDWSKALAILGQ